MTCLTRTRNRAKARLRVREDDVAGFPRHQNLHFRSMTLFLSTVVAFGLFFSRSISISPPPSTTLA